MKVKYFKATRDTHRFIAKQKIWIRDDWANHFEIWHRWRGFGEYVTGIINKIDPAIGKIDEMEVEDGFGERILGRNE